MPPVSSTGFAQRVNAIRPVRGLYGPAKSYAPSAGWVSLVAPVPSGLTIQMAAVRPSSALVTAL
jgi:hypothetical protein